MQRDYYEVLGVDRDADESAIKKAFRRGARELHPDVNTDDPDAEERFKELAAAYEVLSDGERRATYDRFGHEGLNSRGGAPDFGDIGGINNLFEAFFGSGGVFGDAARQSGGGAGRGADIEVATEIGLRAVVDGADVELEYAAIVGCDACDGTGAEPGTGVDRCGRCGGAGRLRAVSRTPFGAIERVVGCDECHGRGELLRSPCGGCDGRGVVKGRRSQEVSVPAGVEDGQVLRVRGGGHAASGGGEPGDLFVHVKVTPDEHFVREGGVLYRLVDVPAHAAALGATIEVETFDGIREAEIPAGSQHGDRITLRGLGLPTLRSRARGDLIVVVNVVVPVKLTEEQREVLARFGETVTDDNFADSRRGHASLFGRLRRSRR